MASSTPQEQAEEVVLDYVRDYLQDNAHSDAISDDIYIVWFSYTLGNWKALVSTKFDDDLYYEVTFDKAKGSTYLDVYKKVDNHEHTSTPGVVLRGQ